MRVLFFGTPSFSVPALEALHDNSDVHVAGVVTQPDRPAGRGGKIQSSPVKDAALARGIPVLQPNSVRKEFESFREQLNSLGPVDIAIVIAFGQILPRAMLDYPRMGCVNVHGSLLPRWRGAAPIQRAILAGDTVTGVCLMQMDEGLDTGGVYSQASTPITVEDTFGTLHDRMATLGAQLLARDLPAIASGRLRATPQPVEGVTYAAKITSAEGEIDWTLPSREISLKVRGLSPAPGAYTSLAGKRLKVLVGRAVESDGPGSPGEVLSAEGDRLQVACGSGTFILSDVQLEGKRRMNASEFLRGNQLHLGSRLG